MIDGMSCDGLAGCFFFRLFLGYILIIVKMSLSSIEMACFNQLASRCALRIFVFKFAYCARYIDAVRTCFVIQTYVCDNSLVCCRAREICSIRPLN